MFGFYLMTTWLVPFALFISLAANEQTLPGGAGTPFGGGSSSGVDRTAFPPVLLVIRSA